MAIRNVIYVLLIITTLTTNSIGQIIKTNSGPVLGRKITSYGGRTVTAFEGIPYAKPPIGALRFKAPVPVDQWTTTLVANTTYICIQLLPLYIIHTIAGVEDCLYLYVYVPRENITADENLNVVVGIHGGAFMIGNPHMLCGPNYLMDRDLIYVSINYRLGSLGFLSTEDEVVPGNNGLKDQVLALKWIKDNIQYFGGNPNSITIVGLSAGGASVHYHYLSPMSKGLFTRGFSQSGTTLNPWALTKNPAHKAMKLAKLLNCTIQSSSSMIDCLQQVNAEALVGATKHFFVMLNCIPYTPFGPVIEKGSNSFLPDHPYKLLHDGKINDGPWITSNTVDEGIYPVGVIVESKKLELLDKEWNTLISSAMDYNDTVEEADKLHVAMKLREFYMHNETLTMENINQLIKLFSDRVFIADSEKSVRMHAAKSKFPVYYYFFDYKLEMNGLFTKKVSGVAHSDDGRLLYPIIGNPSKLSSKDEQMKNILIDFIYNFASGSVPKFGKVEWKPVDSIPLTEGIHYLHVSGPDNIKMRSIKELTPTAFWNSLPIKENECLYKN